MTLARILSSLLIGVSLISLPLLLNHWTFTCWLRWKRGEQTAPGRHGWVPTPVVYILGVASLPVLFPSATLLVVAGAVYLRDVWRNEDPDRDEVAQSAPVQSTGQQRWGFRSLFRVETLIVLAAVLLLPVADRSDPNAWCGFGGGSSRSYVRAFELVWPLMTGTVDTAIQRPERLVINPGDGSQF
jgi:hypothetical protein